jgi:hypothetical protein
MRPARTAHSWSLRPSRVPGRRWGPYSFSRTVTAAPQRRERVNSGTPGLPEAVCCSTILREGFEEPAEAAGARAPNVQEIGTRREVHLRFVQVPRWRSDAFLSPSRNAPTLAGKVLRSSERGGDDRTERYYHRCRPTPVIKRACEHDIRAPGLPPGS